MSVESPPGPRLLFVISGAFGDLALAIWFVYGQDLAARTAMALPEQLYSLNQGRLPVRTYQFRSVEEILRAARHWEADVVLLMSAYGFPIEGLCTPEMVRFFVNHLRQESRRVVTTDPFLGSAATITESAIMRIFTPPQGRREDVALLRPSAQRMADELHRTADAVRDVVHIFPTPTQGLDNPAGVPRMSYFNPRLADRYLEWEALDPLRRSSRNVGSTRKAWLFVLAPNDIAVQENESSESAFTDDLVQMFERTVEAGRRPVLIGPPPLVERLGHTLPTSLGAELVAFCPYRDFAQRLGGAEHAFFWNMFSCSAVLGRLGRRLPAFFFAEGHVARLGAKIQRDGERCYFGGWKPTRLKYDEVEAERLRDLAAAQGRSTVELLEYWAQSPTPDVVIDRLLDPESAHESPTRESPPPSAV